MPFDSAAVVHIGRVSAELAKKGTPIGFYENKIADHARSPGLNVVANSEKFERVSGLLVEYWLAG